MGRFKVLDLGYGQKKIAEDLFLTGWVKNCDDKSVECEVSGKRENIDFFVNCQDEVGGKL